MFRDAEQSRTIGAMIQKGDWDLTNFLNGEEHHALDVNMRTTMSLSTSDAMYMDLRFVLTIEGPRNILSKIGFDLETRAIRPLLDQVDSASIRK